MAFPFSDFPMARLKALKLKRLAMAASIGFFLPISSFAPIIVFAPPAQAQVTANDTFNRIRQMRLTQADFQTTICGLYAFNPIFSGRDGQACNYLTSLPEFYSDQRPVVYAFAPENGVGPDRYVYNLLGATNGRGFGNTGSPQPDSVAPGDATIVIRVTRTDATNYGGGFINPPWFTPAGASDPYVSLTSANTIGSYAPGGTPQRDGSGIYSTQAITYFVFRTGSTAQAAQATIQFQGTAQPGVHFDFIPDTAYPGGVDPNQTLYFAPNQTLLIVRAFIYGAETSQPERNVGFGITAFPQANYVIGYAGFANGIIPAYTVPSLGLTTNATEIARGGNGQITFTADAASGQDYTINYTVGGTAQNGTDYSFLDGSVIMPAGRTSVTLPFAVPQQSSLQPDELLSISLNDAQAYNLTPNANGLTYRLLASTPATPSSISVAPSDGGTIQPGASGSFTVTRSGDTSQPLPVNYTLGGSATQGSDYSAPGGTNGTVTIPAGQTSVALPITAQQRSGSTAQPEETITFTPTAGAGYDASTSQPATLTIPAYTPATTNFESAGGTLTPGSSTDGFTITRSGSTTDPLTVSYAVGGTARPGQDYGQLPGAATIPAGQTSITVPLQAFPQSGTTAQPARSIDLTLNPGNGYAPGNTATAAYTIPAYNPPATPEVTVSMPTGGDSTLTPGGTADGFTVTRTGDTSQPLPINYTTAGTAQNGTDYERLDGDVTIPAGQSSATVPIRVPNSVSQASNGRTLQISLAPGQGYTSGATSGQTYTIDVPTQAPQDVPIGTGVTSNPAGFVVSRPANGDLSQPVTIPYTVGGTAQPGTDFAPLSGSVTIPAGQSAATIPLSIQPSATAGRTVTPTFNPPAGYEMAGSTPSYTIAQSDIPTTQPTTISAATGSGDPRLILSRPANSDLSQAVTLPYTVGGTAQPGTDYTALPGSITIPAGQTTAEVPVDVLPGATPGRSISADFNPPTGFVVNPDPWNYTIAAGDVPTTQPTQPTTISASSGSGEPSIILSRPASGDLSQPITIPYTVGGTAQPGTDYEALPGSVTIPAGQTTVQLPIEVLPGATSGRTITADFEPPAGVVVTPDPFSYTIAAGDVPTTATPQPTVSDRELSAVVVAGDPPRIVVTRSQSDISAPLVLPYTVGGTAQEGVDIAPLSGIVRIPAGQTQGTIELGVLPEATAGSTVELDFEPPAGYTLPNDPIVYTISAEDVANAQSDRPTATPVAQREVPAVGFGDPNADGTNDMVFTLVRSGDTTQPLTVRYVTGGTMVAGEDYRELPGTATFAAGASTVQVPIDLLRSEAELAGRTLTLTMLPDDQTQRRYAISAASGQTQRIQVVSTPVDPIATAGNSDSGDEGGSDSSSGGGSPLGLLVGGGVVGGSLLAGSGSGQSCPVEANLPTAVRAAAAGNLGAMSLSELNATQMTLGELAALGDLRVMDIIDGSTTLAASGLLPDGTTLADLGDSLYRNADRIGDVPGLAEYLAQQPQATGLVSVEEIAALRFSTLDRTPALASVEMGSLRWDALPGSTDTLIKQLPNWEAKTVAQVPGLADRKLGELFSCLAEQPAAPAATPSSSVEQSTLSVSGSRSSETIAPAEQ